MKRGSLVRWLGRLVCVASLVGCGDEFAAIPEVEDEAQGVGEVAVSLPLDFSTVQVDWSPCPLHEVPSPSGEAECADVAVPLTWDDDPRTLTIHLKRKLADATEGPGAQLWFLAGGPGSAGTRTLPVYMEAFAGVGVDTYAIDHRGTGGSSLLSCPGVQEKDSPDGASLGLDEIDACVAHLEAEHGDALLGYAETYSAIDLRAMIEAERRAGQKVFLNGGSGGTMLAQRFLQLFPDAVDGVILEAINPPDRSIVDWGDASASAMRTLLDERCMSDPACGPRLDGQPFAVWERLLEDLDAGSCPGVTDVYAVEDVERLLSNQLLSTETQLWLIPAMIHRLRRCEPADVSAYLALAENAATSAGNTSDASLFSWTLLRHISFSELVHNDAFATDADIEAYAASQRTFGAELARTAREGAAAWKPIAYRDPQFDNGWAQSSVPMLMIQGALDPLTPATGAQRVADHFAADNQQYVLFPNASHRFGNDSTVVQTQEGAVDCRFSLWLVFMGSFGQPIEGSCAQSTPSIDFDPPAPVVLPLIETENAWE